VRVRPFALALYGTLAAALVAGPAAYVLADKSVTLDIDGSVSRVHSYAATVGDLLHQRAVAFGSRDVVSPSPSTVLADGMRVAVVNARPVTIDVDGSPVVLWTTAQTVAELTDGLGVRFQDAYLSTSRSARIPLSGLTLSARLPKSVTVVDGGRSRTIVTTASTWAEALVESGIVVGARDVASMDPLGSPVDGGVDVITRVSLGSEQRLVAVPFTVSRRPSALVYVGSTKVLRAGRNGVVVQTWHYTVKNGRRTAARLVDAQLKVPPVQEILAVGTRPRPVPVRVVTPAPAPRPTPPPATSVDSLNWGALAACESGGNPTAVGGGGRYFGLYQFGLPTWVSVGGSGNPVNASSAEQTYRAKLLYLRSGAGNWPYCGQFLFK
jgi:uncharacterized protein YabE (DUF348 family)